MNTQEDNGTATHWLRGGGSVGEQIRTKDWSTTPLGAMDQWSQCLKVAVQLILTSRQSMFIWWGESLIFFYNNAYQPFLENLPSALGQPAREIWAERWDQLAPLVESIQQTHEGIIDEPPPLVSESGNITYYTCAYSSIPNFEGGVGGILGVCSITDNPLTAVQMRTLASAPAEYAQIEAFRQESESRFHVLANLVPDLLWCNDPLGVTLWYNQQWLEYTGQTLDEACGYGWLEAVHPDDRQQSLQNFQSAIDTRQPLQQEHRIRGADGTYRWFLVRAIPQRDEQNRVVRWFGSATDIHDRHQLAKANLKRIEDLLLQRDEIHRIAVETSQIGIWELDAITWQATISPEMALLMDYPVDQTTVSARQWQASVVPDDLLRLQTALSELQETDTPIEQEYRVYLRDGGERWLYTKGRTIRDESGRVVRIRGVCLDITLRKQQEAELKQVATELRSMNTLLTIALDAANAGWGNWDWRTGQIEWSDNAKQIMGFESEVEAQTVEGWFQRIHPDDRPRIEAHAAEMMVEHQDFRMEYRIIRPDGSIRHLLGTGRVLYDESDQPTGSIGLIIDQTDRKQMEEALLQQEVLRRSEERLRQAIAIETVGVIFFRINGEITDANDAFLRMVGYSRADLEQGQLRWDKITPPEYLPRFQAILEELRTTGIAPPYEKEYLQQDGNRRWGLFAVKQLDAEEAVEFVIDISDRKRAELELAQQTSELTRLNQRLEEVTADLARRNQDLKEFAYIVSHDLKTPLRGIRNLSQWIQDDLKEQLPAENREQLRLMINRVNRMEALINDLLQYSRAGRMKQPPEQFVLGRLVQEVLAELAVPRNVLIQVTNPDLQLYARRLMLRQVLSHLIRNALQHGCINQQGEITIRVQEEQSHYEFAVIDLGAGIDSSYHDRIFNIFETLQPKDDSDSTGTGLAIAKKLVESEGGRIWVESEPGMGATFLFTWRRSIG